jgi:hypothetical protein
VAGVRVDLCCPGYRALTAQGNTKPITIDLAPAPSVAVGKGKPGSVGGWNEHPSYCFVMWPPATCEVTSITIRNAGTALISVHGATTAQAADYMQRVDHLRTRLKLIPPTPPTPPIPIPVPKPFGGKTGSIPPPLATASVKTGSGGVRQDCKGEDGKVESCDEDISLPADTPLPADGSVTGAEKGVGTVGSLIDTWAMLVPQTQLLSVDQLVRRIPGKVDRVRTWKFQPGPTTRGVTLLAIRCWPFYDRPRNLTGPTSIALNWVALYAKPT